MKGQKVLKHTSNVYRLDNHTGMLRTVSWTSLSSLSVLFCRGLHLSDPVVPLFYLVLFSNKSNIVRYSFDFLITKLGINNFYQGIRRSIYIYFLTSQQVKLIQLFSFFLMRTSCWREKWEFPRKFNSIHSKVEEFLFWKTHDWTSKFKIKTTITITDNIKHHHTDGSGCSLKKIY